MANDSKDSLGVLRSIRDVLNVIKNQIAAIVERSKAEHASAQIEEPVRLQSEAVHTEHVHNETRERKRDFRDTIRLGIEIASLGFVVLVAWYTGRQLDVAKETYKLSAKASHIEQRAWLRPIVILPMAVSDGSRLISSIELVNTGKTPAKHVIGKVTSRVVPKDTVAEIDYSPRVVTMEFGFLWPEQQGATSPEGTFKVPVLKKSWRTYEHPFEGEPLTSEEAKALLNGDSYLILFGEVTYEDVYSRPHWVHFCYWKGYGGEIFPTRPCVQFNDTDNDD